jgi:hypothetical protein
MGARSGQRNARLQSEGRVKEEQAESESGKGRVPYTNGMLERKKEDGRM